MRPVKTRKKTSTLCHVCFSETVDTTTIDVKVKCPRCKTVFYVISKSRILTTLQHKEAIFKERNKKKAVTAEKRKRKRFSTSARAKKRDSVKAIKDAAKALKGICSILTGEVTYREIVPVPPNKRLKRDQR